MSPRSLLVLTAALAVGCSDDPSTSSSSTSSSGSTGNTSSGSSGQSSSGTSSGSSGQSSGEASSSGGNTCGYEKDCVPSAAPAAAFCSSAPGTKAYQCCKPATPASSAGCTKASGGENESVATYCCTGEP